MRKLTITTRITIWYTVFLLILTGCALFILTYTGNVRTSELAQTRLMDSVADASEEIGSVGEDFIIDDDLNFYDDGIYLGVYDGDENLLEGRRPAELSTLPKLNDGYMNTMKDDDGDTWYIYDSRFELDGRPIWVRGIVKDFAAQSSFSFMLRISAIVFPILVILAAIGGYIITRRAFKPVRKIIETVEEISEDGDLSKRVDLGDMQKELAAGKPGREAAAATAAKDEIHSLAYTFNSMFDKLEKSFEEEKQFTSDVSHELRTPLAVIISQSDYAKEDEAYRQQALDVINREAKRMAGLVNRLLTLARSDSGKLKLDRETVDLSALCESVAEQQEPLAVERNMKITTDIDAGIKVCGDEAMLIRILLNLVDNAIKYGSKKSLESKSIGHIKMALKKKDLFACFSVEDDGSGIEEEHLQRIWERFYRVDTSRSDEGSGFGLSMVKALAKAHGGEVEASSKPGEGSRFAVYLPLADKAEQTAGC